MKSSLAGSLKLVPLDRGMLSELICIMGPSKRPLGPGFARQRQQRGMNQWVEKRMNVLSVLSQFHFLWVMDSSGYL